MQQIKWFRSLIVAAIVCGVTAVAWSADFVQPERTAEFTAACRRQDKKLKTYFTERLPRATAFNSLGSYRVLVHRDGLTRTVKLIPVRAIGFADFNEFREAARQKSQVVGVVVLTFTHSDPFIVPGTHLLLYDGYKTHVQDVHGYDQAELDTTLGPAPVDAEVDPLVGSLTDTASSLANISPAGSLQLYLQLTAADGDPLADDSGAFVKCLLEVPVSGLVTDDASPARELAAPPSATENPG